MNVGLFFGGLGNEAEVSIKSAINIEKNIDTKKHKVTAIFWGKDGKFYTAKSVNSCLKMDKAVDLFWIKSHIDVAFLITHGKYGEDGVLQAMLYAHNIKYTGCRVLSSALCMDKVVAKKMTDFAKIPQVKYRYIDFLVHDNIYKDEILEEVEESFGFPVFVKPANSGSSVGVTKATNKEELIKAINIAKKHDTKVLIEKGLEHPKEIEVAVLGSKKLIISEPGELIITKDFYDFDDKYVKGDSRQVIPAEISEDIANKIKEYSEQIYRLYECSGFARIDFFVHKNKIYFNEINSLPGFTDISMYPMLMKNVGVSYKELINKIISLA